MLIGLQCFHLIFFSQIQTELRTKQCFNSNLSCVKFDLYSSRCWNSPRSSVEIAQSVFKRQTVDYRLVQCFCFNFKLLRKSNIPAKPHSPTGIFTDFWSRLVSYCFYFGRLLANIEHYSFFNVVSVYECLIFIFNGQKCPVPLNIYAFSDLLYCLVRNNVAKLWMFWKYMGK